MLLWFFCMGGILLAAYHRERLTFAGLKSFDIFLLDVQNCLARGSHDLSSLKMRSGLPFTLSCEQLLSLLEVGRRKGYSSLLSIEALREQLATALRGALRRRQLWQLFLFRTGLGLALAVLGRQLLNSGTRHDVTSLRSIDGSALTAAVLITAMASTVVLQSLPGSWLWQAGLTPLGRLWFQSYMSGRSLSGLPIAAELASLERDELMGGVSLLAERRRRLSSFGACLSEVMDERLQKVEDILPLVELVGIGGPAVLLLIAPLLTLIQ